MKQKINYFYWKAQAICRLIGCKKFLTITGNGLFIVNEHITIADARVIADHLNKLADEREAGSKAVAEANKILGTK